MKRTISMRAKKKIWKKAATQLSVNFMVMAILSIAMLSVGVFFARDIFNYTTETGQKLDEQTKEQLEIKLRDPSALVTIGLNRKNIKRGEHEVFGVGVANRDKIEGEFKIVTGCSKGVVVNEEGDKVEEPPGCTEGTCCSKWIMGTTTEVGELGPNEFELATLFFSIDKKAKPGVYIYNIQAFKDEEKYDSVKKVYIEVK